MNRMRPLAILAKKILAWHPVNLARDAALLRNDALEIATRNAKLSSLRPVQLPG